MNAFAHTAADRMNRIYRGQRHIYDATRLPFLLGRSAMVQGLDPPANAHMLEIGCGTAWNLIRAARKYPDARLYGVDVSSIMLESAKRSIARRAMEHRIRVAEADAVSFDPARVFGRASFDRVFISYALSMIPQWRGVLERAMDVLDEMGSLHIVDFGQSEGLPRAFREGLFAWLDRFSVRPIANLEGALADIASSRELPCRFTTLHRGYAVIAVVGHAYNRTQ
jgi:S-adenosylmethionine-diacylgycerolhomoserine-N-methlytransferase